MAKTTQASGGGIGCLGIFLLIALIATAWGWSQGMDPRAATEAGMILSAKVTGGLCLLLALFFVVAVALAATNTHPPRRW